MADINISENTNGQINIEYIKTTLNEIFSQTGSEIKLSKSEGRLFLKVRCPDCYAEILRAEITDKIAEVIAVNYKYEFFKESIKITGLTDEEKELLFTGLIAADLDEDKRYAYNKFKGMQEISIDGVYNFMLNPLKKKWQDIATCMPAVFNKSQLVDFMSYLIEHKKKRVYVDGGRVYDSHYRRLKRSDLIEGEELKTIKEIVLSNCGEVELYGKLPKADEYYLKEFYTDKIFFSTGYFS